MRLLDTLTPYGENQARCATPGYDPDWWFLKDTEDLAKAICSRCPISLKCLEYAVTERVTDGIYGGLTPPERDSLKRGRIVTHGKRAR